MNESNIDRRTVLKSVAFAGSVGSPGLVTGDLIDRGSVRLLEAGVVYDVPDDHSYAGYRTDGRPSYAVDAHGDRVLLSPLTDVTVRRTLLDNSAVVNASKVTSPPATVENPPETSLPTALDRQLRVTSGVTLDEPFEPSQLEIDRQGSEFFVSGSGFTDRLTPGTTVERCLEPLRVTVKTERFLDEQVDDESVPPAERGLKMEQGTLVVDATPTVFIRDYGELSVAVPDNI